MLAFAVPPWAADRVTGDEFPGAQVSREEARQWRVQHPLAVDVPER
ncbi:hypothetical protein N5T16_09530 [Escherichia coli]|nr:hypothetical protein [Escherichia coli]